MTLEQIQALERASRHFAQAIAACDPRVRFGPVSQSELDTIQSQLPLSIDLVNWFSQLAPLHDINIPQSGNDCAIYAPESLIERQSGYRWVPPDRQ